MVFIAHIRARARPPHVTREGWVSGALRLGKYPLQVLQVLYSAESLANRPHDVLQGSADPCALFWWGLQTPVRGFVAGRAATDRAPRAGRKRHRAEASPPRPWFLLWLRADVGD